MLHLFLLAICSFILPECLFSNFYSRYTGFLFKIGLYVAVLTHSLGQDHFFTMGYVETVPTAALQSVLKRKVKPAHHVPLAGLGQARLRGTKPHGPGACEGFPFGCRAVSTLVLSITSSCCRSPSSFWGRQKQNIWPVVHL